MKPQKRMKNPKVAMTPFLGKGNHYSALVAKIINSAGYDTVPRNPQKWKTVNVFDDPTIDLVIVYWLERFYRTQGTTKIILKSLLFLIASKKLRKKKIIYSVENYYPHDARFKFLDRFFLNLVCRKASAIICSSESAKEIFISHFPRQKGHNYHIIPHPSYEPIYQNSKVDCGSARHSLGIPIGASVCLYLGTLRAYKGVPNLIDLFCRVASKNDYLVICGQPRFPRDERLIEDRIKSLPQQVKKRVRFYKGFVEDNNIPVYFSAADFFATNYVSEPANPGSPVLSMTFGLPIYASHTGCLPDIVGTENMYSYDPFCYESRANALERAFRDPRRSEKNARLLRLVKKKHSVEALVPLYKNVLEENR